MFEGFEMFVCVIIGFGDYYGFYGSDEEFIFFIEIYKYIKDKFGNKFKVIFVDIIYVYVNRGIILIFILFRVFFFSSFWLNSRNFIFSVFFSFFFLNKGCCLMKLGR